MKTRLDPIIAVRDVGVSRDWYRSVFAWQSRHDGDEFAVMADRQGEIQLCLHRWGAHDHPTMMQADISPGNGLILYVCTGDLQDTHDRVITLGFPMEADLAQNPNSGQQEFALRDPDGYYLIVSAFHAY
ncbi:VOC family protein [Granulosicoccus sp. 3-233]|uniref:VOC family protein n=1 Tax=Granulosicoccus sp. 3-233 TaxID=3417969 RepID=UPI003D3433C5